MTNEINHAAAVVNDNLPVEDDEVSILDMLKVIAENLRLLVFGSVGVGLVALAASFAIPPTYTAVATFLPPQQQQGMASSLLQSLGAIGLTGAGAGLKNPTDQYISFLKSNVVEDELIRRFNLLDRYKAKFESDARRVLEANVRIGAGKDNIVSVEVDDQDPKFSADLANAFGEELTKLLSRLAITEAQQRRVFFGGQLAATKDKLVTAEQALAATGVSVAALNANPSTALAGPATLRAQVTAQEVKLAAMRSYLTDAAPQFRQTLAELSALRQQLAKAENAQPADGSKGNDYIAKYRDFKYQETLFDLFSRQYELARIDESREGSDVQVIDRAQVPEHKAKPSKGKIAIGSTLGAIFFLLVFIFARNAWRKNLADEGVANRYRSLKNAFQRSIGREAR